ncbi:MAG: DUF1232 domain-containing protein [Methanolobus sp.]|nr:DUF1232 domain-containing protein [Methanolobus sp.]
MPSNLKFCIICGQQAKKEGYFCSSKCACISYEFGSNAEQVTIEGFCNICGDPFTVQKNDVGRFKGRHSDCSLVQNIQSLLKAEGKDIIKRHPVKTSKQEIDVDIELDNTIGELDRQGIGSDKVAVDLSYEDSYGDRSYYRQLKESVTVYPEDYYDGVLRYLPDFYQLLCNIGSNARSNWYTKMLVNCALSYLVLEDDLIPDKEGVEGYLDDLYICAYVLKEIRDKVSKNIILENGGELEFSDDIFGIIYDVVNITSSHLGDKAEMILDFVGLNKFSQFDLLYEQEISKKLSSRKEKKMLLYAMLAVKTKEIFDTEIDDHTNSMLRSLIMDHPELGDINAYMEFIDDNK